MSGEVTITARNRWKCRDCITVLILSWKTQESTHDTIVDLDSVIVSDCFVQINLPRFLFSSPSSHDCLCILIIIIIPLFLERELCSCDGCWWGREKDTHCYTCASWFPWESTDKASPATRLDDAGKVWRRWLYTRRMLCIWKKPHSFYLQGHV